MFPRQSPPTEKDPSFLPHLPKTESEAGFVRKGHESFVQPLPTGE